MKLHVHAVLLALAGLTVQAAAERKPVVTVQACLDADSDPLKTSEPNQRDCRHEAYATMVTLTSANVVCLGDVKFLEAYDKYKVAVKTKPEFWDKEFSYIFGMFAARVWLCGQ